MRWLGIETSCDETALSVFDTCEGILFEQVFSQIDLHRLYGGVVPGLAVREHLACVPILLKAVLAETDAHSIDGIAVTRGPGLAGCLAVGISYGQSIAFALKKPLWGINHLRAHALSTFIDAFEHSKETFNPEVFFPHLGLLVSGGNTLLFSLSQSQNKTFLFEVLAQTQDDAAGEALDKGARLLGFDYPGGPCIEQASQGGNPLAFTFPVAFASSNETKFSFSGLKTSLRYFLEKNSESWIQENKKDICAAYQSAVIEALTLKTYQALQKRGYQSLGLSGGVANNALLRQKFFEMAQRFSLPLLIPSKKHCGDNATMVAFAAFMEQVFADKEAMQSLTIDPNLTLDN